MDTNQVRQILMNELGLTRQYIRDMATEIVETEVKKHVKTIIEGGHLDRMVSRAINDIAADVRWDKDSIRSLVLKAGEKQIAEYIKQHLIITGK